MPTEANLARSTSNVFGVDEEKVKVSDIKTEGSSFFGGKTYYKAKINGKPYRCMVYNNFATSTAPSCAKPGQPIKDNNPLLQEAK